MKLAGYILTDSTAAMSDAAESVVHLLAVGFAYYGLRLSNKPADEQHLYGHERVEFLSVGVEGSVILVAGITIIYQSVYNLINGYELANLGYGMWLMGGAAVINLALGLYILRVGRAENNAIVISNGRHTLTDVWTSAGVVVTLLVVNLTGLEYLDAVVGVLFAGYIMYEGGKLVNYAVHGLMDRRDPKIDIRLRDALEDLPDDVEAYHHLRHRTVGTTTWIEFHATFDKNLTLDEAHDSATVLERRIIDALPTDAIVTIHLEPEQTHEESHRILEQAKTNKNLDEFI